MGTPVGSVVGAAVGAAVAGGPVVAPGVVTGAVEPVVVDGIEMIDVVMAPDENGLDSPLSPAHADATEECCDHQRPPHWTILMRPSCTTVITRSPARVKMNP